MLDLALKSRFMLISIVNLTLHQYQQSENNWLWSGFVRINKFVNQNSSYNSPLALLVWYKDRHVTFLMNTTIPHD